MLEALGALEALEGVVAVKDVRRALKLLEVVHYMLEVVNGVRRVLLVLGVVLCMLFYILEAVEGELRLLEVLEVMRCVLLCILEACGGWVHCGSLPRCITSASSDQGIDNVFHKRSIDTSELFANPFC